MGLTKENQYSVEQLRFAQLGKAIGHPARIRILELFKKEPHCRFEDLNQVLNLSQATVRAHVEKLKASIKI